MFTPDFCENTILSKIFKIFGVLANNKNLEAQLKILLRERSHMTSAAEGGRGFRNADGC